MTDDTPTIAERYARATNSSNLRVIERRVGDVDMLMAAGLVTEGLGTLFYRLRAEVDEAAGELRLYQAEANRLNAIQTIHIQLMERERRQQDKGPTRADMHRKVAHEAGKQADHEAQQGRAFVLLRLKTLSEAQQALTRYACQEATRRRFMRPDAEVCTIVGRALDVWLLPNCPRCDGRGFNGGYDAPKVLCPDRSGCGGSGSRRMRGLDEEAAEFANRILADLERKLSAVDAQMRYHLAHSHG